MGWYATIPLAVKNACHSRASKGKIVCTCISPLGMGEEEEGGRGYGANKAPSSPPFMCSNVHACVCSVRTSTPNDDLGVGFKNQFYFYCACPYNMRTLVPLLVVSVGSWFGVILFVIFISLSTLGQNHIQPTLP